MNKMPLLNKTVRTLALLFLVATVTLTQQSCFTIISEIFSDSEEENPKNQYGQSITFSDCSIEMNAKDDKGNDRLAYHFTAELSGMKEQGVQMILSIESPKGTPHTYVDAEGDAVEVKAKKDFKNKNQTNSFSLKNKSVGIEYSKLHLKKGENTYYVRLTAYDENNHAMIGSSPYLAVTMTGNSKANATFSNCKLELNVDNKTKDKKMLKYSYHYNIQGANGHEVQLILSVESPKGTPHYKSNGDPLEYRNKTFTVNSDNYEKDDWIGLYNNTLNPKPGKNTYYAHVTAKDVTTGKTIGESDYLSYTQTGSSNNNNNSNNKNNNKNSSSNKKSSSSPSASLSNIRLEPNVLHKDERALKCNFSFTARGVKGHNLKLVLSIESPKGIVLYEFRTNNYNPKYDASTWNDQWMVVYNRAFVQPESTTYYVRLMVYDETTGTTLGTSDYKTFTMSGAYG